MKLFRVSDKKEKGFLDVNDISAFGIVTVNYEETKDKYFELWFKIEGNDNPWNCAVVEKACQINYGLASELGLDTYVTEFDTKRDLLAVLIDEIIAEKCFLIPMGERDYAVSSSNKSYLVDEIVTDEDGVVLEEQKDPSKFFEPINITPNPLSFLFNNIHPIYDNIDDSLITKDVYIPINATPNSFDDYDKDEVLDASVLKYAIYKRHSKGLYYANVISREDESPKTYIVLDGVIKTLAKFKNLTLNDKLYLKMFSNLSELDDTMDDIFNGDVKLLRLKALIKKSNEKEFNKYLDDFVDQNYIYKEAPIAQTKVNKSKESKEDSIKPRIIYKDKISKLYFKEFKKREEAKYKLFIKMYKRKDLDTAIYVQIGEGLYESMSDMRDDITKFINEELAIEFQECNNSKYSARFIPSTTESDYQTIDLKNFK